MAGRKLTPSQLVTKLARIERLVADGKSPAAACRAAGVSAKSLDRLRRDYGALAKQLNKLTAERRTSTRDLAASLEQQAAADEVLKVISSSPTSMQPIFDAIVESAVRLCNGIYSAGLLLENDLIQLVAHHNWLGEGGEIAQRLFPMPVNTDHLTAQAIRESRVLHIQDMQSNPVVPATSRELAVATGYQTLLIVPMLRDGRAIGAIVVAKAQGPFSARQIALLQTFADQAVIAIENVRLFNELAARNGDLTESLAQQTATAEVLKVISRSTFDLEPVLQILIENAAKLCSADTAIIFRPGEDGFCRPVVQYQFDTRPELIARIREHPFRPDRGSTVGRVMLEHRTVHIKDIRNDPEFTRSDIVKIGGYCTTLAVPMLRENELIGVIGLMRTGEPRPFTQNQIDLVTTFADQAVIAIANVRLFNEIQERNRDLAESLDQQTATSNVLKVISRSTFDLQVVLDTLIENATRLCDAERGFIFRREQDGYALAASDRTPPEFTDWRARTLVQVGDASVTGRVAAAKRTIQIPDAQSDAEWLAEHADVSNVVSGVRTLLGVPMMRQGELVGVISMWRREVEPFTDKQVELVETFADQAVIAIENVRLFNEIQDKSRQLEVASQHKSEFLANMSHELRTPLNAVIGFSEVLAERMFGELTDKQAEYVNDIHASGAHLLSLINDILDLSKVEAGRMELEVSSFSVPLTVDNAITLIKERAGRHGIALECTIDPALGEIHADERKMKQILLNLLSNAVKFTPDGGRISITAKALPGGVEISVSDTGIGIAPEDCAAVFEEFRQVGPKSDRKAEGTGLGLALARKFVELHGGRIGVTSEPGKGSTFTFSLMDCKSSRQSGAAA